MTARYFRAEVLSVQLLNPHLRRLTLGGPGLAGFASTGHADEWLRVVFPRDGEREPDLAAPTADAEPPVNRPPSRTYTVRRADPAAGSVTIDFVLHAAGVATTWARRARPGDPVGLSNPHGDFTLPPEAERLLLVGDHAALPAMARIIEELPPGLAVDAWVEVADPADRLPLASAGDLRVHWSHTGPGTSAPTALEQLVRAADLGPATYLWMAGEATAARHVRRCLRHERGLARERYATCGYWRYCAEEWIPRFRAAIDVDALFAAGKAAGKSDDELIDDLDLALDKAGL